MNRRRGAGEPVRTGVDNRAPSVDTLARITHPGEGDAFSPRVSHMSDGVVTLRERGVRPRFHSTYYRSISFLIRQKQGVVDQ